MGVSAKIALTIFLLSIAPSCAAAQFTWYVPGAVESPGANDALFSSVLGLTNVGTASASVRIGFIPFPGKAMPEPASRMVKAGESQRVDSVLKTLWGLTEDAGTLTVTSDQPLIVSIVTSNIADPKGTYGLALFSVRDSDLLRAGETGHAIWVSQSADSTSGYRTNVNVTLVDPASSVEINVYDESGKLKGEAVAASPTPAVWQACSIDQGVGQVPCQGNVTARPLVSTT